MSTPKQRLDLLLVERGLFSSREKAQRSIMAGLVRSGDRYLAKAGEKLASDTPLQVQATDRYVGRGGLKLEAALDHFQIDPAGWICLDVGASTGGFTDCLLQRGAATVHAVDSGHDQLDWKIRSDPRVIVREKYNARLAIPADFPASFDLAVIDVSFISLTLILPAVIPLLSPTGMVVALIKPQFELQKIDIGPRGIVRDPLLHHRAIQRIRTFVESSHQLRWQSHIPSPITGTTGNQEFLTWLAPA